MGLVYAKRPLLLPAIAGAVLILAGQLFAALPAAIVSAEVDPSSGYFMMSYSSDGGNTWTKPYGITKNGNSVTDHKISTAETPPAVVWAETAGDIQKVFYLSSGGLITELVSLPRIEAIDMVRVIPSSPFVVVSDGDLLYVTNSVNGGKNWTRIKTFSAENPAHSFEAVPAAGGLSIITGYGSAETLPFPAPAAPAFLSKDEIAVTSREMSVPFTPSSGSDDNAVVYFFEVSADKDFLNPVSVTAESGPIKFSLPADFREGKYFCRIAAWNGLEKSYSGTNIIAFSEKRPDNAPKLALIKPSDADWISNNSTAYFELSVSDPQADIEDGAEAGICLNGTTLESSVVYDKASGNITGFAKIPSNAVNGQNMFKAEISDSAGNTGSIEAKINIDSAAPSLNMTLKNNTAYSNRRDQVIVPLKDEGAGPDLNNSQIKVSYLGSTVEGRQSSDSITKALVFMPASLMQKDLYTIEIVPRDLAGNKGTKIIFSLVIDQTKPVISLNTATPETTEPLVTVSGTVDKKNISAVSIRSNSSPVKTVNLSGGRFSAEISLERGMNTITVTAVDPAGNSTSAASSVHLSAPPDTVFFKFDGETVSDGDFVDPSASIKITDDTGAGISGSTVTIDGTSVAYNEADGGVASTDISSGTHTIILTSGTKTYSLSFRTDNALKINSALACPSPFNPSTQNTRITYNVSKDSEISAYVFDLKGSLVWKESASAGTGYNNGFTWNGKALDGRSLANGLYVIRLIAKDTSGNTSVCSSKVILMR